MKLHDYQVRAVNFIQHVKPTGTMVAMDLGLGKTAVALSALSLKNTPALVVAPVQVCWMVWPQEIKKWTPNLSWTVLHGPDKAKKVKLKRDIYICPYSSLAWLYRQLAEKKCKLPPLSLVLDESSYIKNASTQRFKMLKKLNILFHNRLKLCLSASPAPNGLENLWSQYYMLDSGKRLGKYFNRYRDKYFMYTGPPVYKTILLKGGQQKIFNKVKDITFRLDNKDYIQLPPIKYNKISLRLPKNLKAKYDELEKNFFIELNETDVEVFNAAALSMKLRQFLQGAVYTDGENFEKVHTIKLAALKQLLETNAGQPILAAINFKFEYKMIRKRFGNPPIIYGRTPSDEKRRLIDRWNRGSIPLLLCHPLSVSHGLNLQSGGRTVVWQSLPWSLDQWHQLNGRLHRQGQKHAVIVNSLVFENTVDEVVEKVLGKKDLTQRTLLNALREYSRRKLV